MIYLFIYDNIIPVNSCVLREETNVTHIRMRLDKVYTKYLTQLIGITYIAIYDKDNDMFCIIHDVYCFNETHNDTQLEIDHIMKRYIFSHGYNVYYSNLTTQHRENIKIIKRIEKIKIT